MSHLLTLATIDTEYWSKLCDQYLHDLNIDLVKVAALMERPPFATFGPSQECLRFQKRGF